MHTNVRTPHALVGSTSRWSRLARALRTLARAGPRVVADWHQYCLGRLTTLRRRGPLEPQLRRWENCNSRGSGLQEYPTPLFSLRPLSLVSFPPTAYGALSINILYERYFPGYRSSSFERSGGNSISSCYGAMIENRCYNNGDSYNMLKNIHSRMTVRI